MVGKKQFLPVKSEVKTEVPKPAHLSLHTQLGITFPVTRIRRYMKERGIAERVSVKAAIAVATTLEFLCAEMIEVVGNRLMKDERDVKRIKPRHVTLGIKGDEALMQVMGANAHIAMGGVIPWVEPEVEGKVTRRHVAKAEDTD